MTRPQVAWVRDILESCAQLEEYWADAGRPREAEPMLRDAVERRIEIIGEAVGQLTSETRALVPDIPWPAIKGMRNVVSHEYFRTNWRYLVEVLESDDLLTLRSGCVSLLAILEPTVGDSCSETFRAQTVGGRGPRPGVNLDSGSPLLDILDDGTIS